MGELLLLPTKDAPNTPDEWERARQRAAAASALHTVLVDPDFSTEVATRVANTWVGRGLMEAQNARQVVKAAQQGIEAQGRPVDAPRRRPNNVIRLNPR